MNHASFTPEENNAVNACVERYISLQDRFARLADNVRGSLAKNPSLSKLIHFSKYRIKEPDHLRDKLFRKILEGRGDSAFEMFTP